MLAELMGFLGTSVGGAVFGQVASFIQGRAEAKIREQQQKHEQDLAFKDQLGDYYKNIGKNNPEFNHTLGSVIWMLAATYCTCTILCFCFPSVIVYTLDPNEAPRKISFLFLFHYEWQRTKILELTTGGVGLMLCYPIVFIISSVLTGIVPRRLR